ncbi:hypothetical protein CC2G_006200 [Coprinopsis cinerea AmutBmut pab1-1]|nr:hypothetical protein CC2G_006200 [Coprinopsis cinerea AmutBmut pab1-1]
MSAFMNPCAGHPTRIAATSLEGWSLLDFSPSTIPSLQSNYEARHCNSRFKHALRGHEHGSCSHPSIRRWLYTFLKQRYQPSVIGTGRSMVGERRQHLSKEVLHR